MNELNEMTMAIAVGGLLLLAMIGGFILMWQRQKYLHAALKLAWATHAAGLTVEQAITGQSMAPLQTDSKGLPESDGITKSARVLDDPESRMHPSTHVIAPLSESPGSRREDYRRGSEEDRLRAMLAGRTAVRSGGASPQQRFG